jgi:hypothetical protein
MWNEIVSTLTGIMSLPSEAGKGAAVASTAWATVTDYRMWRSLGWLLLGIIIVEIGLGIWNRGAVGKLAKLSRVE